MDGQCDVDGNAEAKDVLVKEEDIELLFVLELPIAKHVECERAILRLADVMA
jgi:hypothetical protein